MRATTPRIVILVPNVMKENVFVKETPSEMDNTVEVFITLAMIEGK